MTASYEATHPRSQNIGLCRVHVLAPLDLTLGEHSLVQKVAQRARQGIALGAGGVDRHALLAHTPPGELCADPHESRARGANRFLPVGDGLHAFPQVVCHASHKGHQLCHRHGRNGRKSVMRNDERHLVQLSAKEHKGARDAFLHGQARIRKRRDWKMHRHEWCALGQ